MATPGRGGWEITGFANLSLASSGPLSRDPNVFLGSGVFAVLTRHRAGYSGLRHSAGSKICFFKTAPLLLCSPGQT